MQNQKLNQLALKAGIFYIVGQLFIRGITFLTTPVYTRLLSAAQYGEIRVYESWLLIMVPVMSLCLFRSVDRAKCVCGPDSFLLFHCRLFCAVHGFSAAGAEILGNDGYDVLYGVFLCVWIYEHSLYAAARKTDDAV